MINPTKGIEITASGYNTQFMWNIGKYYNDDFYITTLGFKEMYVKKYDGKWYQFSIHPFKAVVIK